MKLKTLIDSLQTVLPEFPDAGIELGFCSCCIYIVVQGDQIAKLNVDEDRFEYLMDIEKHLDRKKAERNT